MKTKSMTLILAIVLIVGGTTSTRAAPPSQMPPLPADLLFTTTTGVGDVDFPRNTIVRVDAETLEVTPFYVDSEAYEVMPISWSPQGDLLAIYRIMPAVDEAFTLFPRQLCILNRAGVLQRCLNDNLPMHYVGNTMEWQHYYPIAWSPDGQTIYFDTEYPTEESPFGYGRRLVEASVVTGLMLRIVYDYPGPYPVTASPDLNHIVVGFGGEWRGNNPAYVFDLTTEERFDVPTVVPALTSLSWTCLPFSPHGTYLTATAWYDLAQYAPGQEQAYKDGYLLLILDTQGTLQSMIGEPDSPDPLRYQECPDWQPDEQAIVFYAHSVEHRYIMRYSLPDQQLTTLYEVKARKDTPDRESNIYSPLVPSPDGSYVALTVSDGPYSDRLVAVLYPDGEIRRIPSPYRFGLYPLWVPPLTLAQ
jgi:hypothetical protein